VGSRLRTTPAMAAGVSKRLWEISDCGCIAAFENRRAAA
jgi:hypothetical protein